MFKDKKEELKRLEEELLQEEFLEEEYAQNVETHITYYSNFQRLKMYVMLVEVN